MAKKFYQLLGLNEDSSDEQIKKAYKKLAIEHHPDRHPDPNDKATHQEIFKGISQANKFLSDPVLRHLYDKDKINDNGEIALDKFDLSNATASRNHYDYLNSMLQLEGDNRLDTGNPIANQSSVLSFLEDFKTKYPQNPNMGKLNDCMGILRDENARAHYDASLLQERQNRAQQAPADDVPMTPLRSAPNVIPTPNVAPNPNVKINTPEQSKMFTAPLINLEKIADEFNKFINEKLNLPDQQGNFLYNQDDFKYEQQGNVHIFTFPDSKSADEFIGRMFGPDVAEHIKNSRDAFAEEAFTESPAHTQQDTHDLHQLAGENISSDEDEGFDESFRDTPSSSH